MKKLKSLFVRAWAQWHRSPETLMSLIDAKHPHKIEGTERLWVIQVNFPMDEMLAKKYDERLEPLREKYGLDFFVIEPGVNLKRFDDF